MKNYSSARPKASNISSGAKKQTTFCEATLGAMESTAASRDNN